MMPPFTFDQEKLVQAALDTGAAPLSIEEGTELAEEWIGRGILHDAKIVAVECGFVWWADEHTAIVGVQDLLTDEGGVLGNEWKTTKEASKWWNEDKWLEGITEGSQIAIYALALRYGTYYPAGGGAALRFGGDDGGYSPRIRVKAISKSTPPSIWPRRDSDGIITFSEERLTATRNALLSKAAAIRAMRKVAGPWQVPGIWCTNQFRRLCEYHEDCVTQRPCETVHPLQSSDPAFQLAVPHIPAEKLADPELVILSASAYSKVCECPEAYRRSLASGKEESLALGTGTVFHSVVACSYQQLKDYQESYQIDNREGENGRTDEVGHGEQGSADGGVAG